MIKKLLIILIMVVVLLCAGCMTTYDITHAATTTKCKVQRCTTITKLKAVDKVATEPKIKAKKYKAKAKKYTTAKAKKYTTAKAKINCPNCDGTSHNCPYWTGNKHMTEQEIKAFEWLEWHYQGEDGKWYELRTGNNEPVEKPDYVKE